VVHTTRLCNNTPNIRTRLLPAAAACLVVADVRMAPGHTALARTPIGAQSTAMLRVSCCKWVAV